MGDFRRTKRPSNRKISSQHRYDHFDNPPNTKTVKIDSQHLYYISFWEQSQDVIKIFVKKLIYTTTAAILIYELQPFYIISIIFNFPFKFFTRFFKLLTPLIRLLLLLILHFKNF